MNPFAWNVDSNIQYSIEAQIANSYVPYHYSPSYSVNNYTTDPTPHKQGNKVSEFLNNLKYYFHTGPNVLRDNRILNIFLTATEYFILF